MKFSAAALALATAVSASYPVPGNMTYTTAVVTSYETYCPGPTTVTYGTKTYEVTKPTTLTITDCPVTVVTPIYSTSAPPAPVYPTVPVHANTTVATTAPVYHPTGSVPPAQTYPAVPPTAGAGKMAAGLVGVLAAVAAAL